MSKQIKKVGGFLGLSGPSTQGYGGPSGYSTPYSNVQDGRLMLDPSIRSLQDQGLNRANGIYGDVGQATDRFLTGSQGLRSMIEGSRGSYAQARVNPILERYASLRGRAQQDLGQRQIGGSSFGYNTMRDIESAAGREEGDARAIAERESFDSLRGLNQDDLGAVMGRASAQAGLNNENYQVAAARLQQELASLGLSQAQIQQHMTTWAQEQNNNIAGYTAQTGRIAAVGKIFNDATQKAGGGGWAG